MGFISRLGCLLAILAVAACGGGPPPAPSAEGYGPNPNLPAPQAGGLPTVKIANRIGWPAGAAPSAPDGLSVTRYAESLAHPRWLYTLPNGDVLVAEASTQRSRGGGFMGWAANQVQRSAGAITESANRITLLRDSDGDGDVDETHVFAVGLNQPFGMALAGDQFFVANTDAVLRFHYAPGATSVDGPGQRILELPYNPESNGHWTRDLLLSRDGMKLYVTVGSVSNVPEDEAAFAIEDRRAAILEINLDGTGERTFASGLRNPNGLAWEPTTGALWVTVNERDGLGDDLVPDYMTSVQDGGFYGWPWFYFGENRDERVPIPANVRLRPGIVPDYALGAHTASLGLAFATGNELPARYLGGAFIGQHGSWNRREFSGYKVVFVPFENGRPSGPPEDFLTGFLNDQEQAQGRPVGVAFDRTGALLVADDVGNIIWRVAPTE